MTIILQKPSGQIRILEHQEKQSEKILPVVRRVFSTGYRKTYLCLHIIVRILIKTLFGMIVIQILLSVK